uniref:Uncharacterized protein n=1 Tax=Romanomermis culicivorax TaxID=13658 RepID=A0A915I458_ROMCU
MSNVNVPIKRGKISTQRSLEYGDKPTDSANAYKIITVDGRSMLMLASEYESLVKAVDNGNT